MTKTTATGSDHISGRLSSKDMMATVATKRGRQPVGEYENERTPLRRDSGGDKAIKICGCC